jgi:hypothetical protein
VKGIFDTKANSGYDDEIVRRYHFPPQYRTVAEQLIGDWIVYREPQRNGGRRAYIAVARVLRIEADPRRAGYSYAVVDGYLPFDRPVPFANNGAYAEAALREIGNPSRVGAYLQASRSASSLKLILRRSCVPVLPKRLRRPTRSVLNLILSNSTRKLSSTSKLHLRSKRDGLSRFFSIERSARLIFAVMFARLKPLRSDRASDCERWGKGRGSSRAYLVCRLGWPRRRSERSGAVGYRALAFRSPSHFTN